MRNPLLTPELRELLEEGQHAELVEVLADLHPNDAAAYLSGLLPEEVAKVLTLLPLELARVVFSYFDIDVQESIILSAGRDEVKKLLAAMPSDDRAAFLEGLDERVREQIFPLLAQAARDDLIRREQYEADQVGAVLSTEYCAIAADLLAQKAIEEVRHQAPSRETIYVLYVVDKEGHLIGVLSLRDLMIARSHQRVGEIMRTEFASVRASDKAEDAAKVLQQYDLIAVPVVDDQQKLLGILTYDDAADILKEEVTEDIEQQAGLVGESVTDTYLSEPVTRYFLRRIPWVAALALCYIVTSSVVRHFEGRLQTAATILVAFLPMVMATGGNVGAQTATVVIRGLAIGDLKASALLAVLWKELRVSILLAFVLALVAFGQAWLLGQQDVAGTFRAPAAIAIALCVHVISAAVLGALIPIGISALRLDPALLANPALTTLADLSGALIYCLTVTTLL